jgi:outer membrane protein OmpA-like peptidoglycan-associated protein
MKKKRAAVIVLAAVMTGLCACGSGEDSTEKDLLISKRPENVQDSASTQQDAAFEETVSDATVQDATAEDTAGSTELSDDALVSAMSSQDLISFLYGDHYAQSYCEGYAAAYDAAGDMSGDDSRLYTLFDKDTAFDDRYSDLSSSATAISTMPFRFTGYPGIADMIYSRDSYFKDPDGTVEEVTQDYGEEGSQNYLSCLYTPFIELYLVSDENNYSHLTYLVSLEGNTLHLELFTLDENTLEITTYGIEEEYQLYIDTADNRIELTRDGSRISYLGNAEAVGKMYPDSSSLKNYRMSGCNSSDTDFPLSQISYFRDFSDGEVKGSVDLKDEEKDALDDQVVQTDPNQFSLSWTEKNRRGTDNEEESKSLDVTYFDTSCDGASESCEGMWIKADGTWYPFQESLFEYESKHLSQSLDENTDLDSLSDEEKADLALNQKGIADEITAALAGTGAAVDAQSGAVTFDSSILFGFDDATLSDDGRAALDAFLASYVPVITKAKDAGSIANLVVEGYTDPQGSYDYNMTLSRQRAQAVVDYCTESYQEIAPYLTAKGCAYDKLIYNDDGSVNNEQSRRVEFHFILAAGSN